MNALAEEWHGDYWVPPFRQHSSLRARQLLDNKTVLVAGDSITRQFGATLALFLLRPLPSSFSAVTSKPCYTQIDIKTGPPNAQPQPT